MKLKKVLFLSAIALAILNQSEAQNANPPKPMKKEITKKQVKGASKTESFAYENERFGDIQMLRYQIPDFNSLTLDQKRLAFYLYEAAICGRDIIYDQKYKYNLKIRKTLEAIISNNSKLDKNSTEYKEFMDYAKRFFFSHGIHHHYSNAKMIPSCSNDYFISLITSVPDAKLPLEAGETKESFIKMMILEIFNPNVAPKGVNLAKGIDNVTESYNNFYEGVTQTDVEEYYGQRMSKGDSRPISHGLNSKLINENGIIREKIWKLDGMYSKAIEKIIMNLEKAIPYAENDEQKESLKKLVEYYRTGDLRTWDEYNIAWVKDKNSRIDVVNGFIEVYGDAIGKRGSYESVVSFKDMVASKRIEAIGNQAQFFEDNSPIAAEHKKKNVKGITAKVITVIVEGGDAAPSTPIGINLPNANWIRQEHGSKSVSLGNIVEAYNIAGAKSPSSQEFAYDQATVDRLKKYGALAGELHTDMHEVIGHASGKINDGVSTPDQTLKNYSNTLEEARADLVALYYILDPKLIEIGVMPSLEVGMAEYDSYIMGGMITQLNRINLGDNLEEAHMRNRQLNSSWAFERGSKNGAIEKVVKNGKTYFHILDYNKMRILFGELLKEIQRIKSEGDYKAATELVEGYGVKVDPILHKEIKERFSKLNVAPYKGFIQPKLVPIMKGEEIIDVKVEYPTSFLNQMMEYGKNYSFLPIKN